MNFSEKKAALTELVINCPYGENPFECIFNLIRLKTMQEKIDWVNDLDENQVDDFLSEHSNCIIKSNFKDL